VTAADSGNLRVSPAHGGLDIMLFSGPSPVPAYPPHPPAQGDLGLHDDRALPPAPPRAGKPDPEDPVSSVEPRALHRAPDDCESLSEHQVLRSECGATLEGLLEEGGDDSPCAHRGSRLRGLTQAYRVAPLDLAIGKPEQWREVLDTCAGRAPRPAPAPPLGPRPHIDDLTLPDAES
jgi:hypothetical protein